VTSSLSQGPYLLIKRGAVVVSSAKEILEELQIKSINRPTLRLRTVRGDSAEEQKIWICWQNKIYILTSCSSEPKSIHQNWYNFIDDGNEGDDNDNVAGFFSLTP